MLPPRIVVTAVTVAMSTVVFVPVMPAMAMMTTIIVVVMVEQRVEGDEGS